VAIQNAASVAGTADHTEAMVAELPKKNAGGGGMPAAAAAWVVWTSKSNQSELVQIRKARQQCRAFLH